MTLLGGRLELGGGASQGGRKVVVGSLLMGRHGVRYLDMYFHGWTDGRRLTLQGQDRHRRPCCHPPAGSTSQPLVWNSSSHHTYTHASTITHRTLRCGMLH